MVNILRWSYELADYSKGPLTDDIGVPIVV